MREAHSIIGTIEGVPDPASWAEDGHTSRVEVCVEIHEQERMTYIGAFSENDMTVRVDLDYHGWRRLSALCDEVCLRIDRSMNEHPDLSLPDFPGQEPT
jgi:hypothetical protein